MSWYYQSLIFKSEGKVTGELRLTPYTEFGDQVKVQLLAAPQGELPFGEYLSAYEGGEAPFIFIVGHCMALKAKLYVEPGLKRAEGRGTVGPVLQANHALHINNVVA